MLTTLDYALGYGRLGWRVFPLWPGEKRPMYKGWPQDATTDEKMIRQYFAGDPTRNIGVVCGEKFDAWDIEVDHLDALGELRAKNRPLDETPIARTGRGGMHILTEPTGFNATRQLHLDGVHIGELKSKGGFIVVAPSKTEQAYSWTWTPINMELAVAPDWLLTLLEKPKATIHKFKPRLAKTDDVLAVLGRLSGAVVHAGTGHRNSYLYWAMRQALEEGVPDEEATHVLIAAGLTAGLDDHEVRATVRSAYDAESASA